MESHCENFRMCVTSIANHFIIAIHFCNSNCWALDRFENRCRNVRLRTPPTGLLFLDECIGDLH